MIISTNFLCWKINFKRSKTIKPCEMFSRVWKPNETPALVFEIVFEKNLSRKNKQLKARRLQQNETTPTKMSRDLSTSSLLKA